MTSVPPAEPRPPPLRPPDLHKSRNNSVSGLDAITGRSPIESSLSRSAEGLNEDDRPLKRRKIDLSLGIDASTIQQQVLSGEASSAQPKQVLVGDLRLLSVVLAGQAQDDDKTQDNELPPLPTRPWKHPKPTAGSEDLKPTHRTRVILDVPSSPDTSHDVVSAPPLGTRPAGYFPWIGSHPEDALNEGNVKQGFYDRPPNPTDRELSSARVSLYNALKHKSGIESLSTLFSLVLEAKNKHGLINSASTFKPPPRVTLAEAKRKSWIADLSDPNVPLRRLSRTIPQGIRGQILLEQCIQNGVPLSRAIWFAKCVGANEIRTLKRKGTTQAAAVGTESKWLRDWTVNVEQFIDSILSYCGQPTWKASIHYAIRLTTRLYLEHLVDRDHYIDWIVKSFATCDSGRLPFWLMIVHIYKQDIVKYRKRGRLLAESLVQKYRAMKDSNDDVVLSLVAKLRALIRDFALNRPQCLIIPDAWLGIREGLESCLEKENTSESQVLESLDQANKRCAGANRQQFSFKPEPKDLVIEILDSANPPYDPTVLSANLFSVCPDFDSLISSCLEWATTKFRCRSHRTYLVVRLVRKWQREGYGVESPLLDLATGCHSSSSSANLDAMKHLIAELSRSHTFPTSKYLQWLNVRGLPQPGTFLKYEDVENKAAKAGAAIRQKCLDQSQILSDLSLQDVKAHLLHQRNGLLARAGYSSEMEITAVEQIKTALENVLTSSKATVKALFEHSRLVELLSDWNWSVRAQVSHSLRAFVAGKVKQRDSKNPLQAHYGFSVEHFEVVRHALEILEDESVLADVIGFCSSLHDEQLQASLVETVIRHAATFSAIGALLPFQTKLNQTYMTIRGTKSTMPLLTSALLDLHSTFPHKTISTRLLRQDLVKGDRGRAIAAFSPFSDGIAESLQQAEATFIDDFEAVLQSEPNMSEQTMSRLFTVLTERIGKESPGNDEEVRFLYCQLMARLRQCRRHQGDKLINIWLTKVISNSPAGFLRNLVFSMIGSGALTIDVLVHAISAIGRTSVDVAQVLPEDSIRMHQCYYNVLTKWEDFARRNPVEMINLVADVDTRSPLIFDEKQLCTDLVLQHSDDLQQISMSGGKFLDKALNTLMADSNGTRADLKATLAFLDIYSLPFVLVRLNLLSRTLPAPEDGLVAQAIKDLAFDGSARALGRRHVQALVRGAGFEIPVNVRHLAEEHVLEMLPKLPSSKTPDNEPMNLEYAQTAIDQAFQICLAPSPPSTKSTSQLIDKLSQLVKLLGNINLPPPSPVKATVSSPTSAVMPNIASQLFGPSNPSSPIDSTAPRSHQPSIIGYFRLLLQLLCLLRPSSLSSSPPTLISQATTPTTKAPTIQPHRSQSDQIKILVFLATLTTHPFLTSPRTFFPDHSNAVTEAAETLGFAHDVMATYVDELSEDARVLVAKILRDKIAASTNSTTSSSSSSHTPSAKEAAGKLGYLFGSVSLCGSQISGAEEMGRGLTVIRKGENKGEWKPRVWEVLGSGGGGGVRDGETSLSLGLFGGRR